MDKEALQRQLEDLEEASERWRAERRRLNAEIDKLETELADAKAAAARKRAEAEKPQAIDPMTLAKLSEAAEAKFRKATQEWEAERAKLTSQINRLEGALAEAIARASNPLRVTQSVKEQFEIELNRVAKEKTEIEQGFLRAKTEWEQEKIKTAGEMVKLRRTAQMMGRPLPKDEIPEVNPKVRDLEKQLKEKLAEWNTEREQLVTEMHKLEEASRQWDTERRQLNDHAGQLQQAFLQAQAKIQSFEVAARKTNPYQVQVEELKRNIEGMEREFEAERTMWDEERTRLNGQAEQYEERLQQAMREKSKLAEQRQNDDWEGERRRLNSQIEQLEQQLQRVSASTERVSNEVVDQLRQQYEQRLQETIQEKTHLAQELQSASTLLESERGRLGEAQKGAGAGFDAQGIESEVARVEASINEIITIIENPNTELSTVIRKNVEKAELDSYLKGILFAFGKK